MLCLRGAQKARKNFKYAYTEIEGFIYVIFSAAISQHITALSTLFNLSGKQGIAAE